MPALNKTQKEVKSLDRKKTIAHLYMQGKTQLEISEIMNLSAPTIMNELRGIRDLWLAESIRDFSERKAQELAKIDLTESEAWEGWRRSCQDAEYRKKRITEEQQYVPKANGEIDPRTKKPKLEAKLVPVKVNEEIMSKGQAGDSTFLKIIKDCIELRCRILGMLKGDTVNNFNSFNINWQEMYDPIEAQEPDEVELAIEHAQTVKPLKPPVESKYGTNAQQADGTGDS